MAPHSSTLAWKIPWMAEPGRLPSMGSHRVRHDCSDLAVINKQFSLLSGSGNLSYTLKFEGKERMDFLKDIFYVDHF